MANRSDPQNEQNGNSEMKDPVQPGSSSSDIDERMTRDYEKAIDETNVISEDRLRRAIPQSSTSYHEPTEDTFDISWRPDPSGHPRRTF
ncbi:hypothetical protein NUH16_003630 [Penicillium rubens]|nr:hypothetical protein NUH16_003630 [Penicillium rubens]